MDFDGSEFEIEGARNPLTLENMPSTSFGETFGLAVQSTLATENTTSEYNYFKEAVNNQKSELIAKSPQDKDFVDRFMFNDPSYNMPRQLIDDGSISYDSNTGEYNGKSSLARTYINKYKDKLDDVIKYDGLIAKHGLLDRKGLTQKSKESAYNDYMEAESKLESTHGFSAGLASFAGSMWGAMQDPVNIALLPFGGEAKLVGTGLAAVGKTASIAAWQEAKIAAVAEVPIQMQAYEWKNNIGIDWQVKDALVSAAASIGMAGIIRAGGSAMIDLSPMAITKLREKATTDKDANLHEALDAYEDMVSKSPLNNIDDHIEAEAVAHQQVMNGEPVRVDDIIKESGDYSDLGKALEKEDALNVRAAEDVLDSVAPDDIIPLYDTKMKPIDLEGIGYVDELAMVREFEGVARVSGYRGGDVLDLEFSTNEKGIRNAIKRFENWQETPRDKEIIEAIKKFMAHEGQAMKEDIAMKYDLDYKKLDDMNINNSGENPLEAYKAQEVETWLAKQEEDIAIPVKEINEKGETVTTTKSLKDEIATIDKDINTLNRLLECTA